MRTMADVQVTWVRRLLTVSGVVLATVLLAVASPIWVVLALAADLARGRTSCPTVRLMAFALSWCALESAGVVAAGWLWLRGRKSDVGAHYALQRWWATGLMRALRGTIGLRVDVEGARIAGPGPYVALCRHASLADALVSAWVFGTLAELRPRYVLKKELMWDPCLDIVGHRLPNYFVDRSSANVAAELAGIEKMAEGLGARDVAVIFPEGTRANPAKRAREMARIATKDPDRAVRLGGLRHVMPPKPAGAGALLSAVPGARVVTMWHVGFDGLDTFGGILRHIARSRAHARIVVSVHDRATVPGGDAFVAWLDARWLEIDAAVGDAEAVRDRAETR